MTDAKVGDYNVLKAQLLKRFRLTEGGYRSLKQVNWSWVRHSSNLWSIFGATLLNGARWPVMRRPTRASKT